MIEGPKASDTHLSLEKINILKTNFIRFMPKRLGCRKFMKKEETLFVKGIKKYHERINLANFLDSIESIR